MAYTVKGGGSSLAWQRRQSLGVQILRRVPILEVKQVYRLFLMQGLNTHNWIWGKMELLSLVYMENFYFFNSPGTMAWPPLTGFSSVSIEILMAEIFVLVKQCFNFNIKLFKAWLHRSQVESLFLKLLKVSCHSWRKLIIDVSFANAINPLISPSQPHHLSWIWNWSSSNALLSLITKTVKEQE